MEFLNNICFNFGAKLGVILPIIFVVSIITKKHLLFRYYKRKKIKAESLIAALKNFIYTKRMNEINNEPLYKGSETDSKKISNTML